MDRAIELAKRGVGEVAPNPMVGCVIVYGDRIIGEGYHRKFGGPHAEVEALASVAKEDQPLLPNATMYVTLEPCAHQGKTPPCAHRIVAEKIGRVVIASADPNPQVGGKGISILEDANISVHVGTCEAAAKALNRPFFIQHIQQRPYVTLKWAQSKDGFISKRGEQTALTGAMANQLTHQWRTRHMAILVGQQTALVDNPRLTARLWPGQSPLRIVWDPDGMLPDDRHLFDGAAPTWVLSHDAATSHPNSITHVLPIENWAAYLQQLLLTHDIQSMLVEGGAATLASFVAAGWWDEFRVWTAPVELGGGIPAPALPGPIAEKTTIGKDTLMIGYRL